MEQAYVLIFTSIPAIIMLLRDTGEFFETKGTHEIHETVHNTYYNGKIAIQYFKRKQTMLA